MKKTGLIAMSAKPAHLGHWSLITKAASENDEVELFVSTSNRTRSGEIPIYGVDMEEIWNSYLVPALPPNVNANFGGSPVGNVYAFLESEEDKNVPENAYVIYSDPVDLERNFSINALNNSVPLLLRNKQIKLQDVSREGGVDISGTAMRQFLANDEKENFLQYLPPISKDKKLAIWNILRTPIVTEQMFKKYINMIY